MKVDASEHEEVVRKFFEFEEQQSLFEFTLRDVPIWEWLRSKVHRSILARRGIIDENPSAPVENLMTSVQGVGLWARNIVHKNPLRSGPADRLYWGHRRRKRLEDGYWWDIYCDPIHEREGADFVHFEIPYNMNHRSPPKTEGLRYLDFIHYTGTIAENLPGIGVTLTAEERAEVHGLESAFEETFGVEVDLVSRMEGHLTRRKYTGPLYRRLLASVDPDVVIVVVGHGKETFIEVCKEVDVPVVELQHGGFGPNHPGYAFPGERTKRTFPDYLFTFGEFWRDSVEYPIPKENVIPVGYPYLEMQKAKYPPDESSNSVLFLSQWAIGEELTRFATEFARITDDTEVVVKLHPGEYGSWRENYSWLVDAPLTVIDKDDPPLYELLSTAAVQVGVYTTVIYEGLNFELDTYLLDLPGVTRMNHLIEQGVAKLIATPTELHDAIQGGGHGTDVDAEFYFEPNPISNINSALDTIRDGPG